MRGPFIAQSPTSRDNVARIKLVPRFFPSTGTAFALTWINYAQLSPRAEGQAGCRDAVLGPPARGTWLSLGSDEGSWDPPTGPRRPPRPQPPVGLGSQSPPAGAAANRGGPPRRDAKQPPSLPRTPHPLHPPKRRASPVGPLGGPRGRAILPRIGRASGEGAPPPEGPGPSPAPHPRCACAHLRHRAVRCGRRAPWGRALDGR